MQGQNSLPFVISINVYYNFGALGSSALKPPHLGSIYACAAKGQNFICIIVMELKYMVSEKQPC